MGDEQHRAGERVERLFELLNPTPGDLFAIRDDPAAAADVDDITFDPDAGGPSQFDQLARLDHPTDLADVFVGARGDMVCLIVSPTTTSLDPCQPARVAAAISYAYEVSDSNGPIGLQIALIPDAFAAAVAQRPELGTIGQNHLVVAADAPPGPHVLVAADGTELTLAIAG